MDLKPPSGESHFVGKKDELIKAKRSFRTLEGRDILIIYHEGVLYAMDSYCYREYGSYCAKLKTAAGYEGGKVCVTLHPTIYILA